MSSMLFNTENPTGSPQRVSSDEDSFSFVQTDFVLPGYEAQSMDNGVHHSHLKLHEAAKELRAFGGGGISTRPCLTEDETWAYRCNCNFQLVEDSHEALCYAMRRKNEPVLLKADFFPIANKRIQQAMKDVLQFLQDEETLRQNVTSISFASSWCESPSSDCFVTLNYGQPIREEMFWKLQAVQLCNQARLTQLTGRSRKHVLVVKGGNRLRTAGSIRDMLWLARRKHDGAIVGVSFGSSIDEEEESIPVQCRKPDTAFFHPNARVMLQALQWMMSRIGTIVSKKKAPVQLLEMYCGCGAHTVALARASILDFIVAVEWDSRLVESCEANCRSNGCYEPTDQWGNITECQTVDTDTTDVGEVTENDALNTNERNKTPVFVFKGDASEWARKSLFKKKQLPISTSRETSWYDYAYDILLVDPPRAGLGDAVCDMAIDGPFSTLLYISCGQDALKRDLQRLNGNFEVVDCVLLDLFPRTDAVESLVHLERLGTKSEHHVGY